MPRIDPLQLLNCLQVLLSPTGGILSQAEVIRLANLMTKFSKKLVSKCVYILILRRTDALLLSSFMDEGGWNLIQTWLEDATSTENWPLVSELLQLLIITPVDVERLKMNNLPKIVKGLTKREELIGVQQLANQLVLQWLKIVKEVTQADATSKSVTLNNNLVKRDEVTQKTPTLQQTTEPSYNTAESSNPPERIDVDAVDSNGYKLIQRDGKHVLCKVAATVENNVAQSESNDSLHNSEQTVEADKGEKVKEKSSSSRKDKDRSSSGMKSSSSSGKDKSSGDKERDRREHRSSSSSKHKSSSSSRDKDRRSSSSSSKSRNSGNNSSSSSSSNKSSKDREKDRKEKQADRDKDTLAKIQPQSLQKVGRIPKKTDSGKKEDDSSSSLNKSSTKGNFSVEVRKNRDSEEKPKTVKIFNSRMRSTGLLDEAKPPPPRSAINKKPTLTTNGPALSPTANLTATTTNSSSKRSSSPPPKEPVPEKKSRLSTDILAAVPNAPERPGAIKLIPPKPKPAFLQESDIFMDALAASANKSAKKRKRKLSITKETPLSPTGNASTTPTSPGAAPSSSPSALKNITPANFYQDTLQAESNTDDDKEDESADKENDNDRTNVDDDKPKPDAQPTAVEVDDSAIPVIPTTRVDANGVRGILSYGKRKGPKKSLRFRPEEELVEVQYFELDANERVNVTKTTFTDMARMEMSGEREALLKSRKHINEDIMDAQTAWRVLVEVDAPVPLAPPGSKSLEKDIQFAREKTVLHAIYFSKVMLPESAAEPDPEMHPMTDPVSIPLEDAEHADEQLPVQPWPEPKGSPPHVPTAPPAVVPPPYINNPNNAAPPNMFPPNFPPGNFPPQFPSNNFSGGPPNMVGGGGPPEMMGPPPPSAMFNNGPPPDFSGNDGSGAGPFPPPYMNGPPMMGPPPFPPMGGPPGNFNNMRGGRGGFNMMRGRGGPPGGGSGWVRMTGQNNAMWGGMRPPMGGGAPAKRGRFCNNVKNHGFCRNRETCPFIHPN